MWGTSHSFSGQPLRVSWYKVMWMGSHLMAPHIMFNCLIRCGCVVCSGGILLACYLCRREICLGSWLKSFLFLVCIEWYNYIFVIGDVCVVVTVVLHVWASYGSLPAVCDHLYDDIVSVNIHVSFFKSEVYGKIFSFNVGIS